MSLTPTRMMQSYEQIFLKRADAYQMAMESYPLARDREFQLAVEAADILAGETVCDAPAGGGYLRAYLPADIGPYLAVETAPDFTGHCPMGAADRIIESPLQRIALEDNCVDACICLAGSHHLEDKASFFHEAARILKPGGRFVLADVETGTDTDRFLNTFVDQNNSMGHTGVFLNAATSGEVAACGFDMKSSTSHGRSKADRTWGNFVNCCSESTWRIGTPSYRVLKITWAS